MTPSQWAAAFQAWKDYSAAIDSRRKTIEAARTTKAYDIAEAAGLPRHAGMIHNATCDTKLQDWCKDDPQRLAAAMAADRILKDYRADRAARRMIATAWAELCAK